MGIDSAELTLDLLKQPSMISGTSRKPQNIDGYLETLEHELEKIDGFKRELPLSMSLLTDAIERLKEERMQSERGSNEVGPVTEELILFMGNFDENGRAEQGSSGSSDKRNWMTSAKLWTAGTAAKCENCQLREKTGDGSATKNPSQSCNLRNRGGTFVPFEEGTSAKVGLLEQSQLLLKKPVGEIGSMNLDFEGSSKHSDSSCVAEQSKTYTKLNQHQQQQLKQQKKKHRRCWSPELHRRFVDALGLLGGPQATPKHIKELMQVDSLTNDEVKSHLQKYRIHVRKQPGSPSSM